MIHPKGNFSCKQLAAFLSIACGLLTCAIASAQSIGPYVNTCSSGVVDSESGVEETVCLTGDLSGVDAYTEVDDSGPGDGYWAEGVGIDASLSGGATWDSGDQCCGDSESVEYTFVPQSNVLYNLTNNYEEDFCYGWGDWDCYWEYGEYGFAMEATVTPAVLENPQLITDPVQLTQAQKQEAANATSDQIQQYLNEIQPYLTQWRSDIASYQGSGTPNWTDLISGTGTTPSNVAVNASSATLTFVTDSTGPLLNNQPSATTNVNGTQSEWQVGGVGPPIPCPSHLGGCAPHVIFDADGDGLDDSFESAVADLFTPYYSSSYGEQDQFATFGDYVPMTVTSLVGTVPPYSYYRVTPLGLATDANGNQVFALRIDYLTLWNADGGLVGGGAACYYSYVGLDQAIQAISGHDLDVERSGLLVAAPVYNGGYNPDPSAYSIYALYTAAHEYTFFDQSMYATFSPAVPAGNHIALALSLSKHSTYTFNPDYYPITPAWFVTEYFDTVSELYLSGIIDETGYALFVTFGDDTFFGCLVERFGDQGGNYANQMLNVGEPDHPLPGGGFIQDDSDRALHIYDKLKNPLF